MTSHDVVAKSRRELNTRKIGHAGTLDPMATGVLVLGIGDDAAIVRPRAGTDWCFSSDMLLAGRHFFADVAPADLARSRNSVA